jgi:hypothetical protein
MSEKSPMNLSYEVLGKQIFEIQSSFVFHLNFFHQSRDQPN